MSDGDEQWMTRICTSIVILIDRPRVPRYYIKIQQLNRPSVLSEVLGSSLPYLQGFTK